MIFYIPGFPLEHRKRPQRIFIPLRFFCLISSVFSYFSAILGLWGGVFGILEAIDYICDMIY